MIRYRNGAYEVVVHVGRDPVTGRDRRVSRTVRMAETKRTPKAVLDVEADLRVRAGRGDFGHAELTVGELLDRWLAHAAPDLSPTTVHGYRKSIRLYLRPDLGSIRLAKLTTARIDRLYDALRGQGLSPATIRQAHAILRRACTQGQRWGFLHANPAGLASPPSVKRPTVSAPSKADVARLIRAGSPDDADLIRLAAGAGLRRGELCGLRWGDVENGILRVARSVVEIGHKLTVKDTKSGKVRHVEIGPKLQAVLKARRTRMMERALAFGEPFPADGYVLSDGIGREPLHPNVASDRFRRLTRKGDITCRLHDLRHYYVTTALAGGADPAAVASQAGHESTKMTLDVYGHATVAGKQRVARLTDIG